MTIIYLGTQSTDQVVKANIYSISPRLWVSEHFSRLYMFCIEKICLSNFKIISLKFHSHYADSTGSPLTIMIPWKGLSECPMTRFSETSDIVQSHEAGVACMLSEILEKAPFKDDQERRLCSSLCPWLNMP